MRLCSYLFSLSILERDAHTLATQSQFDTLLLGREIDDHSMLITHGLGPGPTAHGHIRIGSHVEAVKLRHPAEIVDRTLGLECRYAHPSHLKALHSKAVGLAIGQRQDAITPLGSNASRY